MSWCWINHIVIGIVNNQLEKFWLFRHCIKICLIKLTKIENPKSSKLTIIFCVAPINMKFGIRDVIHVQT